jgi:hypothetical protein
LNWPAEWDESEAGLFHPEKAPYSTQHTTVGLHIKVEKMQRALERTQFALERMRRSLKKHGIVEELNDGESMNLEA